MAGIYIHIPFCNTKCPYCDFASWAKKENLIDKYFEALLLEINTKCEAYRQLASFPACQFSIQSARNDIDTIFIGGGTPSLIPPEYYEKLFVEFKKYFELSKGCEITLELNPGTARDDFLKGYKALGINRISIGAQSFDERILEILGRKHSVKDIYDAVSKTINCGFNNYNLDLIYSVPELTHTTWLNTIYKVLELNPNHISTYSLTIEQGTPFENIYKNKALLPSDDFTFESYITLCNMLKTHGYVHYEISNFAKPTFESKHNLNYWRCGEFYAFGNGAYRYLNGKRTANVRGLEDYIKNPISEKIIDFPIDYMFEEVMLSSRLNSGIKLDLVKKISNKNKEKIKELIYDFQKEGFLELSEDKVFLTDKGMFVNNEILLKLI